MGIIVNREIGREYLNTLAVLQRQLIQIGYEESDKYNYNKLKINLQFVLQSCRSAKYT